MGTESQVTVRLSGELERKVGVAIVTKGGCMRQEKQINTIVCRFINVAVLAIGLVICKWRGH